MSHATAIELATVDLGFRDLKPKQKEAITAFLSGNDVFVSLPTGYGKSVIYGILPRVYHLMTGMLVK